jgi:hypothetical protein
MREANSEHPDITITGQSILVMLWVKPGNHEADHSVGLEILELTCLSDGVGTRTSAWRDSGSR